MLAQCPVCDTGYHHTEAERAVCPSCGHEGLERVRESWLGSSSHEKWAAAMMRCQSPQAACGSDGRCAYGGKCFGKKDHGETEGAIALIERLSRRVARLEAKLKEAKV